ncbi:hypothetical protein [Caulobacter vibrioides]|nr:hypothetical protein [Caulobacter vibrioides]
MTLSGGCQCGAVRIIRDEAGYAAVLAEFEACFDHEPSPAVKT